MTGKAGILSCIAVGSEPYALGHLVGSHGVATYGPAGKNIGFGVGFGRTAGKRNLASNLRHIVGVGLRRKSLMASHAYCRAGIVDHQEVLRHLVDRFHMGLDRKSTR